MTPRGEFHPTVVAKSIIQKACGSKKGSGRGRGGLWYHLKKRIDDSSSCPRKCPQKVFFANTRTYVVYRRVDFLPRRRFFLWKQTWIGFRVRARDPPCCKYNQDVCLLRKHTSPTEIPTNFVKAPYDCAFLLLLPNMNFLTLPYGSDFCHEGKRPLKRRRRRRKCKYREEKRCLPTHLGGGG